MNRLKNVMWWVAALAILIGYVLCGLAIPLIDGQIQHDAYSHARIGLMHVLGIVLAICMVILLASGLTYGLIRLMWRNDPDVGTDDDGQFSFDPPEPSISFRRSPINKPR